MTKKLVTLFIPVITIAIVLFTGCSIKEDMKALQGEEATPSPEPTLDTKFDDYYNHHKNAKLTSDIKEGEKFISWLRDNGVKEITTHDDIEIGTYKFEVYDADDVTNKIAIKDSEERIKEYSFDQINISILCMGSEYNDKQAIVEVKFAPEWCGIDVYLPLPGYYPNTTESEDN